MPDPIGFFPKGRDLLTAGGSLAVAGQNPREILDFLRISPGIPLLHQRRGELRHGLAEDLVDRGAILCREMEEPLTVVVTAQDCRDAAVDLRCAHLW